MQTKPLFANGCRSLLALLIMLGASLPAWAEGLVVVHAWAPATVPGQPVAAVYMQLRSAVDARLVGIESDVAGPVQMHSMTSQEHVMRMREVPEVDLPAGKTIAFAPGGLHIMLTNLKHPLKAGESIRLELTLERADHHKQTVAVSVPVINRPVE
jgi:hypothetical protein